MNTIRLLTLGDWETVNLFCLENPGYFTLQSGEGAEVGGADDIFQSLPEGRSFADKFVYGFFIEDKLVGLAEGIRDYPQNGSWVIGFFIIAENLRKQSLGTEFLHMLEYALMGRGAQRFRVGVLDVNQSGMRFWERHGYIRTGEIKEISFGTQDQRVHVLIKEVSETV